ncbi:protein-L-isoaspartate(D-aspartate) O-methyltransferase [bacterium]|nr:protein-L-isoaspartate(D-aspartate) O-methyltransferase [bacterium]MBU1676303.1 protein-L-isoaspartate(D-aspartate) O-methyltransferase [bacterium]
MRVRRSVRLPLVLMIGLSGLFGCGSAASEDPAAARARMMREVDADVARSPEVLGRSHLSAEVRDAMLKVPRHEFVPSEMRRWAHDNRPLPIGSGQTISQPTVVAMMSDLIAAGPGDTVLEVGTGSGYQAAVLSEFCAHVHTIEIVPELARSARKRLAALGYDNVTVYEGDGYLGVPEHAPYAGIIVTAAPDHLPPALVEQLAPGRRLVIPVGRQGWVQELTVVEKSGDGRVTRREVLPVRFVPLTREDE